MKITGQPRNEGVRTWRRALRSLEREIARAIESQTECCGVTAAQCHLLLELEAMESASLGELSRALELDASTLSRTVDGLVVKDYVSREPDADNRRKQVIALSAEGRAKVRSINALCDAYYGTLLASFPEGKRKTLLDAVPLLADALKELRAAMTAGSCRGKPDTAIEGELS